MPFFRYIANTEYSFVVVHKYVPNFDLLGRPKTVYFTDAYFDSASAAESELRIGKLHPSGPFTSPAYRLDLDLTGITYSGPTPIPGSPTGRNEFATTGRPTVTKETALNP